MGAPVNVRMHVRPIGLIDDYVFMSVGMSVYVSIVLCVCVLA